MPPTDRSMLGRIVSFSRALHRAGVDASAGHVIDLCRSLQHVPITSRTDFYLTARAILVSRQEDLETFDQVFGAFWESALQDLRPDPSDSEENTCGEDAEGEGEGEKQVGLLAVLHEDPEEGETDDTKSIGYSPDEVLAQKDLAALTGREIEEARKAIAAIVDIIATKISRRRTPARNGREIDFRRTWRRNIVYGKDGVSIATKRRKIKKTRLMLICDVSGSMDCYSRFLIQFIYGLKRELKSVDVAVFTTRLTVISQILRTKSVEASLAEVARSVRDWGGSTDIGKSLREFNEKFSLEMLRSNTVVVILSDGWDRGEAELMRREMEHLRRRSYKVI
jgi:uncharacterized protein with von Willebrand factor type A (vWA) domain